MDALDKICAAKREHIRQRKETHPLPVLKAAIEKANPPRGFVRALRQNPVKPALIAEIKKASPSAGVIRADFDPEMIANIYEESGSTCLSVLTDKDFFQGSDAYIEVVQKRVNLPVLRKDFMLEPYQIYESRALGADCVLLIIAALTDAEVSGLYHLAKDMGMDVLVETHDESEVIRALDLGADMIGINNRNLKTLNVDLETCLRLRPMLPDHVLCVAESGIRQYPDVERLALAGFDAMLVGESLMKQPRIGNAVDMLLHGA